jgi:uncharacterized integral membrane protein
MNANKHNVEHVGANPRDHVRHRRPSLRHAHKDWRVWVVVAIMLSLILVYVMTDNLSLRPNEDAGQPVPAMDAP